jgi:sugar/nucleoside kinase (ribokinase family)
LQIGTVVIHPRKGAAGADAAGTAWFAGPFVKEPKLSTGAGDNFNAGFVTGRLLGLNLEESLCAGTGTSGYYVRNAGSPTVKQLAAFIADLPAPE